MIFSLFWKQVLLFHFPCVVNVLD
uniref:Uncharacterized protein n=1 Tax=Rhizophora mucronata TaxID=61149 RepID=A0A2P2NK79_RHIMU